MHPLYQCDLHHDRAMSLQRDAHQRKQRWLKEFGMRPPQRSQRQTSTVWTS